MAIKLLFALDVEDWADPEADDAVLRLCKIAQRVGIKWGLFVVAEKARALVRRARLDVIDAMRRHQICYHLDAHGPFPEPVVLYSDRLNWDEAVAKALFVESRGLRDVEQIFDRPVVAWCQGEANWSPQLVTAIARLGLRWWNGAPVGANNIGPAWYCTSLVLRRAPHFVSVQPEPSTDDLFAAFTDRFRRRVEEKGGEGFIIVFGHPTRWIFKDWFLLPELGLVRQGLESRPTQIAYSRPTPYTDREIEKWFEQTEQCLRWCIQQPEVEVYTYSDFARDYGERGLRWVDLRELLRACRRWLTDWRYDWVSCDDATASAADVFAALAWALARYAEAGTLPARAPLRRPLGPTYPYPEDLPAPLRLNAADFLRLCTQADAAVSDFGAVPHALRLASAVVPPGPLLLAMVEALDHMLAGRSLETVQLRPAPPWPACAEMKCFQEMALGSHSLPQGFEPHRVRLLAKMQSWSFRPALPSRR